MLRIRCRLSWLVCGWLVCQLGVLTFASAALYAETPGGSAIGVCTCSHGDGRDCPMHHQTPKSKSGSCRSANDAGSAGVVSLLGPLAVLPRPKTVGEPVVTSDSSRQRPTFSSQLFPIPDAPPPRA